VDGREVVGTPYIYASIKTIEGKENPNPLFLAASFSLWARCSFLFLKWLLLQFKKEIKIKGESNMK
jgi:hypothetical protein